MVNEKLQIQYISKPFNLLLQFKNVFHVLFFLIGLSIGIMACFCFRPFFSTLQISLHLPAPPSPDHLPLPHPLISTNAETSNHTSSVSWEEHTISLMHNMSDQQLFSNASMASRISINNQESSSSDHLHDKINAYVGKVAFMFLTKGPLPLAPLWEKFLEGHQGFYSIYVHSHPSYQETLAETSVFYNRRIPSQPVYWGTSSMVNAERRLLANALLDLSNQRFVLLSESCIPLFNFTTTYHYLMSSNLSFVGSFDDPRKPGRGRYNPKMWPQINITHWRKGSQWFEVKRELALEIISDTKFYLIFSKLCLPPCYMDEHYIPTMVNMKYLETNSNRSITWVDWSRGGPHPRKFGWDDITDEFLNQIRYGSSCDYNGIASSICFLFARKFLPDSLEPLLKVAPLVLGFDP